MNLKNISPDGLAKNSIVDDGREGVGVVDIIEKIIESR